ncbi:MAG: NmrA family NAD(P)-binding protein [Burkholderiales bacterium]|nr:NmrA family NAD(P)-binding protein [Burkholderiales bacterium]
MFSAPVISCPPVDATAPLTDTRPTAGAARPARPARVLVLGANGRFGRAAVSAFASAGWHVTAQVRRDTATTEAARRQGIEVVLASFADRLPDKPGTGTDQASAPGGSEHVPAATQHEALVQAARQADVIVHALNPDYTQWDSHMPAHTAQVVDLALQGHALLMLPGNVYNFGCELPPVLAESTPFVANTPKARQRITLEAALVQAGRQHGLRSVVIRAGNFLAPAGQGETWLDLGMGRKLAQGVYSRMSSQDVPTAWAWLPDLAQVFVQVAERREVMAGAEQPRHQVLHYAGHTLTDSDFKSALERVLGTRLRIAHFPWWMLRLLAPVAPMFAALVEMRYLSERPHRLDDTRLQALLGHVAPLTPIDACLHAALAKQPVETGQVAIAATRAG